MHLRRIHNGLGLIAAQYEERKEDGEDAAADNHRARHIC